MVFPLSSVYPWVGLVCLIIILGAVIFGGIDTKKYSGSLEKLSIIPASDSPDGNTR